MRTVDVIFHDGLDAESVITFILGISAYLVKMGCPCEWVIEDCSNKAKR